MDALALPAFYAAPLGRTAATYADARLIPGTTGAVLHVLGRTMNNDGGQGAFTWVAGGSTTINDGSELSAPGGVWKRPPDQLYTPQIFGAVGDGVTDDTAAIQRAIAGLANGQTLTCLPNSTYAIDAAGIHFTSLSNLDVNFNGAHFVSLATSTQNDGVGGFVAVLFTTCTNCKVHGGNYDGKTFKGGFIALTGCIDCEVYANYSTNVGNTSAYQFGSNNCTRSKWHNNTAASPQAGGTGVRGFWLGNSNVGFIDTDTVCGPNNKAISNTASGFVIQSTGAQIFGNYALSNAGSGFLSSTATGAQSVDHNVICNTAIGNTFHGYQTDVTSSVPVLRVTLSGNRFEGNAKSAIYLNYAQFFSVTGNLCLNNCTDAANTEIQLLGSTNNGSITANTIVVNTAIAGDAGIQLYFNSSTLTDITISGNNITGGSTAQGFGIEGITNAGTCTVQRLSITGNVMSTLAHGITLRAANAGDTWDDVVVANNTMTNMGTDFLRFQSTNANQITKARAMGNSGSITIDANTVLIENLGNTWNVALTAPTISSGFGTSPSVTQNAGYRSFSINVGTGGTASAGVIGLPAAAHGWSCAVADVTTPAGNSTVQTGSTTTTVTVTNYSRTTGLAAAWPASDILQVSCWPN